ncbi:MAG TPA: hypothetical protein VJH65_02625 [Candidatus Nanoarchaeia archaeon]|nr:hypothetical protein [Candidatus Nanoarchaeia archaeon]
MEKNAYLDIIRKVTPDKNIKMVHSEKKEVWTNQNSRCFFCKKTLNKFYFKFVKIDGNLRAVCLDCYFDKGMNKNPK